MSLTVIFALNIPGTNDDSVAVKVVCPSPAPVDSRSKLTSSIVASSVFAPLSNISITYGSRLGSTWVNYRGGRKS